MSLKDNVLWVIGPEKEYYIPRRDYKYHVNYYAVLFDCWEEELNDEQIILNNDCINQLSKRGYIVLQNQVEPITGKYKEYLYGRECEGILMFPQSFSEYQKSIINERLADIDEIYLSNISRYLNSEEIQELPNNLEGNYIGTEIVENELNNNPKKIA